MLCVNIFNNDGLVKSNRMIECVYRTLIETGERCRRYAESTDVYRTDQISHIYENSKLVILV